MSLERPFPPDDLDPLRPQFRPAPELEEWARAAFIDPDGPLANPEHDHLQAAVVRFLWTTIPASLNQRRILGMAEIPTPRGKKWIKERQIQQLCEWFGGEPDFLITIYADYAAAVDDASFCALVEHELYHCGQAVDEYGHPKFHRDGSPRFAIRGHDVEEFVGVVERYGAGAAGVGAMVQAANRGPTIGQAELQGACGTCRIQLVA